MKTIVAFYALLMLLGLKTLSQTYQVTDLGTLGGGTSRALAINNQGQIVGEARREDGSLDAFLYNNGAMSSLGILTDRAFDINDSGDVVGQASFGGGITGAFLYSNALIQDLGGGSTIARSINNTGQIVGYTTTPYMVGGVQHAFLYSGGIMQDLASLLPGGHDSQATMINDSVQVFGFMNAVGGSDFSGFLYSNDSMQTLGALGIVSSSGESLFGGMNDGGGIVGGALFNGALHAFLFSENILQDIGLQAMSSYANAINNHKQIVGNMGDHAFLFSGETMYDLNTLIDPASGWVLREAFDINEVGQIVGWGENEFGTERAFLLEPNNTVPEPAGWLGTGLLSLVLVQRFFTKKSSGF